MNSTTCNIKSYVNKENIRERSLDYMHIHNTNTYKPPVTSLLFIQEKKGKEICTTLVVWEKTNKKNFHAFFYHQFVDFVFIQKVHVYIYTYVSSIFL